MSNQNKKCQETEIFRAALTAMLNLIVFTPAAVAFYSLFQLVTLDTSRFDMTANGVPNI